MIEAICPGCGNTKTFTDDKAGRRYKCPSCGSAVLIGQTAENILTENAGAPTPGEQYIPDLSTDAYSDADLLLEQNIRKHEKEIRILRKKIKMNNGFAIGFALFVLVSIKMVIEGHKDQGIAIAAWIGIMIYMLIKRKQNKDLLTEAENNYPTK